MIQVNQLLDAFIPEAYAATSENAGSLVSLFPMFVLFALAMYFLVIRPQTRRQRAHQQLMETVKMNDAIHTVGGICGFVVAVHDDYVKVKINKNNQILVLKTHIAQIVTKDDFHLPD